MPAPRHHAGVPTPKRTRDYSHLAGSHAWRFPEGVIFVISVFVVNHPPLGAAGHHGSAVCRLASYWSFNTYVQAGSRRRPSANDHPAIDPSSCFDPVEHAGVSANRGAQRQGAVPGVLDGAG